MNPQSNHRSVPIGTNQDSKRIRYVYEAPQRMIPALLINKPDLLAYALHTSLSKATMLSNFKFGSVSHKLSDRLAQNAEGMQYTCLHWMLPPTCSSYDIIHTQTVLASQQSYSTSSSQTSWPPRPNGYVFGQ